MSSETEPREGACVVDASVLVDLLARTEQAPAVVDALRDRSLHGPAHLDVEVLSALGRLFRGGTLTWAQVASAVEALGRAPIERHPLPGLLAGAWRRQDHLRISDALYVELAETSGLTLLTTDRRLARAASCATDISVGD